MNEIRGSLGLPACGPPATFVSEKDDKNLPGKRSDGSHQPHRPADASGATTKIALEQCTIAKGMMPPQSGSKSSAALIPATPVETFFKNAYKSPGSVETLSSLRDKAFTSGYPFFFVIREMQDEKTGLLTIEAAPCSLFYDQLDRQGRRELDGETQVYVIKKGSESAYPIGSINGVEGEKNPLGHHLLMLNNEQFEIDDPENIRGETIAAASILFELGICVPVDKVLAAGLMARLSTDEQRYYIGRVMIDALIEEDYRCAEACLKYGGGPQSVDDHGHVGLSCALGPGAYDFLQKMLDQTGTSDDLPLLRSELEDCSLALDPVTRQILSDSVTKLSRPKLFD